MRRTISLIAFALVVLCAIGAAVVIFKPALAPTYLYYDLVGRWAAPLPPDVERFVLQSGDDYCAQGHDTECGGYRIVGGRALAVGPGAAPPANDQERQKRLAFWLLRGWMTIVADITSTVTSTISSSPERQVITRAISEPRVEAGAP